MKMTSQNGAVCQVILRHFGGRMSFKIGYVQLCQILGIKELV